MDKASLLAKGKRRTAKVTVDGFGELHVRSLTEAEWAAYQRDSIDFRTGQVTANGIATAKPRLIALCVCDEKGERVFGNSDVPAILDMDAKAVNALYEACEQFAGVTDTGKNSKPTDDDSLPTS